MINKHHENLIAGHFRFKKTRKLSIRKYFRETLKYNIKIYLKSCDVYLVLKIVKNKPYRDLQSLPVEIYHWENLLKDFVTGLPISTNWKGETYDLILVIVNRLMKIVYYKPVNVIINAFGLSEVIIKVIVQYYGYLKLIISDCALVFTSKFWSSLY